MARGWKRIGAEDVEQFLTSNGISIKELSQAQDNSCLERNAAKDTTIMETLSSDHHSSNLPHLLSTVGHLLIGHGGHLQTQFLHQSEVNHCRVRSGDVG